jgi:hypothetical protein
MKRILVCVVAVLGVTLGCAKSANASGCSEWCYSGYQPWWNIFAKRYKCLTPEEERLQKFWHDYYDAMKNYYAALDHIDWVAYYKNHGIQAPGGACGPYCGGRINYLPVMVTPSMQWAVPQGYTMGGGGACGPYGGPMPAGPGGAAMGGYPMGGNPMAGYPMGGGYPMPQQYAGAN